MLRYILLQASLHLSPCFPLFEINRILTPLLPPFRYLHYTFLFIVLEKRENLPKNKPVFGILRLEGAIFVIRFNIFLSFRTTAAVRKKRGTSEMKVEAYANANRLRNLQKLSPLWAWAISWRTLERRGWCVGDEIESADMTQGLKIYYICTLLKRKKQFPHFVNV